ncbi:MAG: hypothetical protein LIO79_05370 [Rikenellaceae bacterium]|nr:hypothetical protein [Rikenellaceae bacterium]
MKWYKFKSSSGKIQVKNIPLLEYREFYDAVLERIPQNCHCSSYFGVKENGGIRFFCFLMDNDDCQLLISSWFYGYYDLFIPDSLTSVFPLFHPFEREITEKYGVNFKNNPYNKPLKFPHDRYDKKSNSGNYPYYTIPGHSFHEVNVGPIHAGIIEPGIFRFICNGVTIIHLEIVLGFQHRGIESLIGSTPSTLKRICLAENIAGDSAVSHALAFCGLHENLSDKSVTTATMVERHVAQ